ncbi:MAG: tetratricopeptide repeat protein [Algicola sp.]|nr:tetratricopeptide repeat protein [Algicola sp.]
MLNFIIEHQLLSGSFGAIVATLLGIYFAYRQANAAANKRVPAFVLDDLVQNKLAHQAFRAQQQRLDKLDKKLLVSEFQRNQIHNSHIKIINDLVNGMGDSNQKDVESALVAIAKNDKAQIAKFVNEYLNPQNEAEVKRQAQQFRQRGCLLKDIDADKSLEAYLQAGEIDPKNLDGLTQVTFLYMQLNRLEEATESNERLRKLATKQKNNHMHFTALINVGEINKQQHKLDDATSAFEQALQLANDLGDVYFQQACHHLLGQVHHQAGHWQSALNCFEKSQIIDTLSAAKITDLEFAKFIGATYVKVGQPFKASSIYFKVINQLKMTNKKKTLAVFYTLVGRIFLTAAQYEQALTAFQKSLAIHKSCRMYAEMLNDYDNIAQTFEAKGALDYSLAALKKDLTIRHALKDNVGVANSYNKIGRVLRLKGEHNKALSMHKQAAALFQATGDKTGLAISLNYTGDVWREKNNENEFLQFYNKALAISENLEDRQAVADVYSKIGRAYLHVNKPAQAEEAIQKSVSDSTLGMSGMQFYQLGELYFAQGRFEDGKSYVLQAIEYFVKLDDFAQLALCYKLLIAQMGENVPVDYVNNAADYLDKIGKCSEATIFRKTLDSKQDGKLAQGVFGGSSNGEEKTLECLDEPDDDSLDGMIAQRDLDMLGGDDDLLGSDDDLLGSDDDLLGLRDDILGDDDDDILVDDDDDILVDDDDFEIEFTLPQ